jgi:hypothetical protein
MSLWIQIAALLEPTEGAIIASSLRANGVRVCEPDFHLYNCFPNRRIAYGGYRIMVLRDDLDLAKSVSKTWTRQPDTPAEPCPNCAQAGRRDTHWLGQLLAFITLAWSFNYRLLRNRRHCTQCGSRWTPESSIPEPFSYEELGYNPEGEPPDNSNKVKGFTASMRAVVNWLNRLRTAGLN